MAFGFRLGRAFYRGASTSDVIPALYPVAIGGHGYMIELGGYQRGLSDSQRNQADTGDQPGESTLPRDAFSYRNQSSLVQGAGQAYFDGAESTKQRFWTSKGINPWTVEQTTLLHSTSLRHSSAQTNIRAVRAGTRVYHIDNQTVRYSSNADAASPTWTAVTGTPAAAATGIATDGTNVWIAFGASGIYKTDTGTGVAAIFGAAVASDNIWYCNTHLLVAAANVLSEVDAAGARAVKYTHTLNTAWRPRVAAAGPTCIYVAGDGGGRGDILKFGFDASTGAMQAFGTPACDLQTDEACHSICSYGGYLFLGTTKGLRLAEIQTQSSANGALSIGAVITQPGTVYCIEPYGSYLLFGWSNYDGTSTGLGRLDPSRITTRFAPAFASDLMGEGSGLVRSILVFNSKVLFAVETKGIYGENDTFVQSGVIDTGLIRFGVLERKIGINFDLRHEPLVGSISATLTGDDGATSYLGASSSPGSTQPSEPMSALQIVSENFRATITLTANVGATSAPVLRRWTIRARVTPSRQEKIRVPIILHRQVRTNQGAGSVRNVAVLEEFQYIRDLAQSGVVVNYQEGSESYPVVVDGYALEKPERWVTQSGRTFFDTLLYVDLITVEG